MLPSDAIRDVEAEEEEVAAEVDLEAEPADPEVDEDEVVEVHAAGEEVAREDKKGASVIPIIIPSSFLSAILFFLFCTKTKFFSPTNKSIR